LAIINAEGISAATFGPSNGGNISIDVAGRLTIDGTMRTDHNTGITAQADNNSTGNAGAVSVAAGSANILANGRITGESFGSGDGGNVTLRVADTLIIDGTGKTIFTGITASAVPGSTGKAGSLTIDAGGAINVSAGGRVGSATGGEGNGGSVQVTAQGALTLRDPGTKISALAALTGTGTAGSVSVRASQVTITTGAQISSTTAGTGEGGSVIVTTPGALVLDGAGVANTQIAASATGSQSGPGGKVTVTADSLTIEGGAQIASSTAGPGKGGDVAVTVTNGVTLAGSAGKVTASAAEGSSGQAGEVVLMAGGAIALSGGAQVSSSTAGTGKGGTGQVTALAGCGKSGILGPDMGYNPRCVTRCGGTVRCAVEMSGARRYLAI
jgi:hypothetical protein